MSLHCPISEADRNREPQFLAGDVVAAGTYIELNSHSEITLRIPDSLPATLNGQVAVYVRRVQTWEEIRSGRREWNLA